jgi:hypothetical protein
MGVFIIILVLVFAVCCYFIQLENHNNKIRDYIESIGGEVINIERRTFSTGPFILVGRGRTVYRIEYRTGNETREGWVRFGGFFGPDWRL